MPDPDYGFHFKCFLVVSKRRTQPGKIADRRLLDAGCCEVGPDLDAGTAGLREKQLPAPPQEPEQLSVTADWGLVGERGRNRIH